MNIAVLAVAVLAQSSPPAPAPTLPPPPPGFAAAMETWGTCMDAATAAASTTETVEVAARQAIAACATQQQAATRILEAWVEGPDLNAEQKAFLRERLTSFGGHLEQEMVRRIRASRRP